MILRIIKKKYEINIIECQYLIKYFFQKIKTKKKQKITKLFKWNKYYFWYIFKRLILDERFQFIIKKFLIKLTFLVNPKSENKGSMYIKIN